MWRALLTTIIVMLTSVLAQAEEEILMNMSHDQVAITAGFEGSQIIIFGAVKRETEIPKDPLNVIVTISGPKEAIQVRRKSRKFGIWINTDIVEVDEAPSFYAVATSAPWDDVLSATEDLRYKISIPLAIRSVGAPSTVQDSQSFTEALIRINTANELYSILPSSVNIQDNTLFHTAIDLPANLVEGNYEARVFLTRNQSVVSQYNTKLDVKKVGLERFLFNMSRDMPLAYALMSLVIAGVMGWAASAIFTAIRSR